MSTISLCMIVRNEEKNIERCLKSAAKLVDEIIVVDTGSEDGTKTVCKKYKTKLYDFVWEDDFAAARNFAVEKASSDWIMWLDADEELQIRDKKTFKKRLRDEKKDLISIKMLHYYGEQPADKSRAYRNSACRLFRNNTGMHFSGKVHERLIGDNIVDRISEEEYDDIKIFHYGYMDEEIEHKNDRNMKLLLKEREEQPENAWVQYHLAVEYYHTKAYAEAYGLVNLSILCFLKEEILPPAIVYKLKYDILLAAEDYETVSQSIEKAIELYPDYVDLYYYKGMAQFALGDYKEAKSTFRHCLILGEDDVRYLILAGAGSFLALNYIGRCHEMLQEKEQAQEAYRQAELLL